MQNEECGNRKTKGGEMKGKGWVLAAFVAAAVLK